MAATTPEMPISTPEMPTPTSLAYPNHRRACVASITDQCEDPLLGCNASVAQDAVEEVHADDAKHGEDHAREHGHIAERWDRFEQRADQHGHARYCLESAQRTERSH